MFATLTAMRVGYFGGTFDPPHRGHLAVALAAAAEFSLDKVLLAPTGRQPLKAVQPTASFTDRLSLVELLCAESSPLEASDLDGPLPAGGPNYTIDALHRLRAELADTDTIFVLAGADAFLDLRRWRDPDGLLAAAEWIVISRPGFSLSRLDTHALTPEQRRRVYLLETVHEPVSATGIRTRLREGLDCSSLLLPGGLAYIREHHLYGA